MKIKVKLFALLGQYLPAGAVENTAELEVADGASPTEVMEGLSLPFEQCHLVLVDGVFVSPSQRDTLAMTEGQALAIWPPVAGG